MGGQGGAGVEGWSDREELFFVELIGRCLQPSRSNRCFGEEWPVYKPQFMPATSVDGLPELNERGVASSYEHRYNMRPDHKKRLIVFICKV